MLVYRYKSVYILTHIHIYIYVYMYIYTYIYIYIYSYVDVNTFIYIHITMPKSFICIIPSLYIYVQHVSLYIIFYVCTLTHVHTTMPKGSICSICSMLAFYIYIYTYVRIFFSIHIYVYTYTRIYKYVYIDTHEHTNAKWLSIQYTIHLYMNESCHVRQWLLLHIYARGHSQNFGNETCQKHPQRIWPATHMNGFCQVRSCVIFVSTTPFSYVCACRRKSGFV